MIVDDHPINIKVAESILTSNGFQTKTMEESGGVVEWVEKNLPDLVLLDIMMPGLDGLEVCRRLKANPVTAVVPVIFLTAKGGTENLIHGFQAGGVDYVAKPVSADELVARVRAHVRIEQLQKSLNSALAELQKNNQHLQDSLDQVAKLKGALLLICAWTKQVKVGDEWISIDKYLSEHLGMRLSHGISTEGLAKFMSSETAPEA